MNDAPFDVEAFLAEPITARLATNGPTVRPIWYQWEDGCFWLLSGPWARLYHRVREDPMAALVVDVAEVDTGRFQQVIAHGSVEFVPWDIPRGRRMLVRYQGPDLSTWPRQPDRTRYLREPGPPGVTWLRLRPDRMRAYDYSWSG